MRKRFAELLPRRSIHGPSSSQNVALWGLGGTARSAAVSSEGVQALAPSARTMSTLLPFGGTPGRRV
jgi:hypothetical protein